MGSRANEAGLYALGENTVATRKHADAVPEGVERMLTKVSEEEQERGLAIAPPPPLHEARSRSGGSWGPSNPGADMAGCEPTCSPRAPSGSSSTRSLSLHRLRLYPLSFEARVKQARWPAQADSGSYNDEYAGTLTHRGRGWAMRRQARDPTAAAPGGRRTTLLESVWACSSDAWDPRRPRSLEAQAAGPAVGVRAGGRGVAVAWRLRMAMLAGGWCGEVGDSDVECRHYCRWWLPRGARDTPGRRPSCGSASLGEVGILCACRAGGVPVSGRSTP